MDPRFGTSGPSPALLDFSFYNSRGFRGARKAVRVARTECAVDTPRKVSATRVRAVAVTDNVVFAVSVGRPRDPIGPSNPERSSQLAERFRDKSIFLLYLSYFLNARATQVTEE